MNLSEKISLDYHQFTDKEIDELFIQVNITVKKQTIKYPESATIEVMVNRSSLILLLVDMARANHDADKIEVSIKKHDIKKDIDSSEISIIKHFDRFNGMFCLPPQMFSIVQELTYLAKRSALSIRKERDGSNKSILQRIKSFLGFKS